MTPEQRRALAEEAVREEFYENQITFLSDGEWERKLIALVERALAKLQQAQEANEHKNRVPICGARGATVSRAIWDEAYLAYAKQYHPDEAQRVRLLAQGFYAEELDELRPGWRPVEQKLMQLQADRTAAEALERAAQIADSEEEPAEGEMPPSIIASVLAQDTVAVEHAIVAGVRATKKNIATNIRSLKPHSDMPRSQVDAIGLPPARTWEDYRRGCHLTYNGGHDGKEAEAFHHGIDTVFNLLEAEFPPAELCKQPRSQRIAAAEGKP